MPEEGKAGFGASKLRLLFIYLCHDAFCFVSVKLIN
jgi:hypothetical protein